MKKSRVVLNFIKFAIGEKIAFFRNIIIMMTNNVLFPTPDISMEELTLLVETLSNDYTAAQGGGYLLVSKLKQSKDAADEGFRKLANYVNRIADGDPTIILSSGFNVSKQPERSKRDTFTAEAGENPCEVTLTRKAQPGAKSYVWQYCIGALPSNEQAWVYAGFSTQVRFVVVNLESGSKCWFRVAAITSRGTEPWSAPLMRVVP